MRSRNEIITQKYDRLMTEGEVQAIAQRIERWRDDLEQRHFLGREIPRFYDSDIQVWFDYGKTRVCVDWDFMTDAVHVDIVLVQPYKELTDAQQWELSLNQESNYLKCLTWCDMIERSYCILSDWHKEHPMLTEDEEAEIRAYEVQVRQRLDDKRRKAAESLTPEQREARSRQYAHRIRYEKWWGGKSI